MVTGLPTKVLIFTVSVATGNILALSDVIIQSWFARSQPSQAFTHSAWAMFMQGTIVSAQVLTGRLRISITARIDSWVIFPNAFDDSLPQGLSKKR